MSDKLMVGLNLYPKDGKLIDLREAYRKIKKLEEWNIEYLFENIVIKLSSHNDRVIIEDQGNIFYYRTFEKEYMSAEDLKSMWNEVLELVTELNLDVRYENEIDISIHAKNPQEIYERNKQSIEEFGQNLLHSFSLSVISDKASALATITPVPETVPFKVLG